MAYGDVPLADWFDEKAATYCSHARSMVPGYDAIYDMASALLSQRVPEQCKLLVVGAGGGSELVAFGAAFPRWGITGVDPSPEMLSIARARVDEQGIGDRVETVCGKVEDIPAERRFDAATCILVMHFIEDDGSKLEFLKELGKRLNPGAPLIVVNLCGVPGTEEHSQKLAALVAYGRKQGKPAESLEKYEATVMKLASVTESRDIELLKEAGFRVGFEFFRALYLCGWIVYKE